MARVVGVPQHEIDLVVEASTTRPHLPKLSKKIDPSSTEDDMLEVAKEVLASLLEAEDSETPILEPRRRAISQLIELAEIKKSI